MARPDTWMPMYWRDFWADTGHLSPVEGWAYLNLIGAYWTNGGPLANDDARLQRQAKVSAAEWRKARHAVIAFFAVDDTAIHHKRIDQELATATKRHAAKVEAGVNGAKKRWRTDSTAIAEPSVRHKQTDAQLQPHSPNGDSEANASDTRKPRRATALPADWTPNERNLSDAKSRGYDQPRVVELAEQFRDYHHAKGSTSKDWDASWRTWLANDKRFAAGRAGSGKPGPNRPSAGSVVDVVARLKARADLGGQGQRGGVGRSGHGVSPADDDHGGYGPSDCAGGEIIDADDAERMHRSPGRTQAARTPCEHDGADDGSAALAVFAEAIRVPGGRGAQGADDAAEHEPVLALVVGTEGEVGRLHSAAPEACGGPEIAGDMPDLPDFLRRT